MIAKPWDKHRATITKLYIQQGRTLDDVRGIMKTEYNFEASIRSYRQHFDIWDIGKYNCKKRQQRRYQSGRAILKPLLPSLPSISSYLEISDPGPSPASRCASQLSLDHLALPAIQPPQRAPSRHFDAHQFPVSQSSSLPEARIKIEDEGVGPSCKDVLMYPSAARHHPQSVLQLDLHYAYADSAHLPVQQATPPQPPPCSMPPSSHCLHDYCQPLPSYMPGFSCRGEVPSGLRAPNMPVVRGMEVIGPW